MALKIGFNLPNPLPKIEGVVDQVKKAVTSVARGAEDVFETLPVYVGVPSANRLKVGPNDWQPGSADPFEPAAICPEGPYKGQRYDISSSRSVHVLSPQEAAPYHPQPGETLVANVWHDDHFFVARIPPNGVQDVILQGEHEAGEPFPGHTQMRFTMKPGQDIQLVPQVPGDGAQPTSLHEVVMTTESIGVPGQNFDLLQGDQGKFGLAYRMMGLDDKIGVMTENGQLHSVDQWRLNLSDADKQAVLSNYLKEGSDAGLSQMYNTLTRNCSTESFRAIDSALHYNPIQDVAARATGGVIPPLDGAYLAQRGLLGPDSQMPNLQDEVQAK